MKWFLAITLILIFILTGPGLVLAKSSVQKLKDPVTKFTEHDLVFEEIIDQGDQAVPELISLLQEEIISADPDEVRRHWGAKISAMNILSEFKAKDALSVLKDMLENSDDLSTIYNSARAIGNIGGNNAYKILEEVFINAGSFRYAENNLERKKAAIAGLGLCENKKAIPYLIAEMNNPNSDEICRIYAAGSLGLLGVNSGLGVAKAGLSSNDEYVRMASVRALGIIGDKSAVAELTGLPVREVIATLSGVLARQHHLVRPEGLQHLGNARLSAYRFAHQLFQRYLRDSSSLKMPPNCAARQ